MDFPLPGKCRRDVQQRHALRACGPPQIRRTDLGAGTRKQPCECRSLPPDAFPALFQLPARRGSAGHFAFEGVSGRGELPVLTYRGRRPAGFRKKKEEESNCFSGKGNGCFLLFPFDPACRNDDTPSRDPQRKGGYSFNFPITPTGFSISPILFKFLRATVFSFVYPIIVYFDYRLFQKISPSVIFQHPHLLNGNAVELD